MRASTRYTWICLAVFITCIACIALPRIAVSTVWMPVSTNQLVERSDLIVSGTVLDRRFSNLEETPLPATIYTIEIDEMVRGTATVDVFELPVYGGCFGDYCEGIAGVPELTVGEAYVLFLEGVGAKSQPFVGGPQGVYRVVGDGQERYIVDFFGNSLATVNDQVVSTARRSRLLGDAQAPVSVISIVGESRVVDDVPPDLLYDDFLDLAQDVHLQFACDGGEVDGAFVVDIGPDSEWTWLLETSSIDYALTRDTGLLAVGEPPVTFVTVDAEEGEFLND